MVALNVKFGKIYYVYLKNKGIIRRFNKIYEKSKK